jgi:perosamine synthetase
MGKFLIPLATPDLTGNEIKYVTEALQSNQLSFGSFIYKFENNFAEKCNTRTSIVCANGTCALHLALRSLNLGPGDEVIVPSFTYVATANAVKYCGAEPVFVDVDKNTWCIDPKLIEKAITPRTKGIIPVHLFGHPADMDPINRLAEIYNLWVVEDAAEAVFAKYKGRPTGSLGNIGVFSFHSAKVLTSGEGGALTLNDKQLESFIRMICSHGMDTQRRFFFPVVGFNYRLTNMSAGLLCAQLERSDDILSKRRKIFEIYTEELKGVPGISLKPVAPWAEVSPWLFSIVVSRRFFHHSRDDVIKYLAEQRIESRPFFTPIHNLPVFREGSKLRGTDLPITDILCSDGMNLPSYNIMTEDEVKLVVTAIKDLHKL